LQAEMDGKELGSFINFMDRLSIRLSVNFVNKSLSFWIFRIDDVVENDLLFVIG